MRKVKDSTKVILKMPCKVNWLHEGRHTGMEREISVSSGNGKGVGLRRRGAPEKSESKGAGRDSSVKWL